MSFCEVEAVENGLMVWFFKATKQQRIRPSGPDPRALAGQAFGEAIRGIQGREPWEGTPAQAPEPAEREPELEPCYALRKTGIFVPLLPKAETAAKLDAAVARLTTLLSKAETAAKLEAAVAAAYDAHAKADGLGLLSGGFLWMLAVEDVTVLLGAERPR